ncbi:hypothetical protein UFOVP550_10 [uncultured Caudovirales phage]|uniref:Uncharacterized protein n=1 Tax=uncultured Caudovirales phage TaxID=2100421 RepID=A0A6J5MUS8_9CAUD|nr:hypothetical protein UFOVP550_10 [uncultured Caudovirales phage]
MAAGLGFKTFATGDILTAADANGYLMSQTVMVFADAAARSAAITSPQEGMLTYLKDTNATEYYSGSAWVAVGGGSAGALIKITSGTFSGSANFSVDSVFSSTYANYKVIVVGTSGGGTAASIKVRFRTGGTTNTTSNYSGGRNSTIYSSGGSEIDTSNNDSSMTLGRTDSNGGWWLSFDCLNPFLSESTSAIGGHTDVSRGGASSGRFNGTTSFDGINILGGANLAGSYYIYGYGN